VTDERTHYHVGLMTDAQILEAIKGPPEKRRIPYCPDDPKPIDQTSYIRFATERGPNSD
jgi:hypothetical protein